jgi:pimeloyl-ACP methyl ester carboxylesterase
MLQHAHYSEYNLNQARNLYPLLLVPGMMNDERVWRHQLAALKPRCSEVQVADVTTADTIEEIARLILESAPEKFSLAGFSMGGIVALEIWRQAPGRVLRLALLGSTARNEKPHHIEARLALMERANREPMAELMQKVLIPPSLGKANQDDSLIKWEIQDMGQLLGIDVYLRQCQALNTRRDYRELLGEIRCPSLVICGEEDQVCPAWISEQLAQGIAGSTLLVIKGSGHMVTLEAPEEVSSAMLSWLAKPAG